MISLAYHGSHVSYSLRGFLDPELWLSATESDASDLLVTSPLPIDDAFKEKDFDVYFLVNSSTKESDIFQCWNRTANRRIGWIIPVAALDSAQHDYSKNEHFLRYAWVAMRLALASEQASVFCRKVDVAGRAEISFSELFDPSTALLIVSKETLADTCEFEFERAAASLASFGYVAPSSSDLLSLQMLMPLPTGPKLYYDLASAEVGGSSVISSLIQGAVTSQSEVLRFFYLYQIIELLIERVFVEEQADILRDLVSASGDSSRTKDVLYRMSEIANEKRRICILINQYTKIRDPLDPLRGACSDFLRIVGRTPGSTFENFLYPVRNFIFHQFRQVPAAALEVLEDINRELLRALPMFLSSFSVPTKANRKPVI
jgi:hypothetical protein